MKKLALSFVLLNTLDIILTLYFVGSGISYEFNPVMARVLEWPLPAILAFKIALPAALAIFILLLNRQVYCERLNFRRVLTAAVICELAICVVNLSGLLFS